MFLGDFTLLLYPGTLKLWVINMSTASFPRSFYFLLAPPPRPHKTSLLPPDRAKPSFSLPKGRFLREFSALGDRRGGLFRTDGPAQTSSFWRPQVSCSYFGGVRGPMQVDMEQLPWLFPFELPHGLIYVRNSTPNDLCFHSPLPRDSRDGLVLVFLDSEPSKV